MLRLHGFQLNALSTPIVLCLCLWLLGSPGSVCKADGRTAPQEPEKKLAPYDTIQLTSGRKIAVNVRTVNQDQVSYYLPNSHKEKTFHSKNVHKIIYKDGRIEKISGMAYEGISDTDWRIVILTDDPEMTHGLFSHGMVYGESNRNSRSLRVAKRNAETRIKKRAVAKKAMLVLITKRTSIGGYGEVPKYRIEGECYGSEPDENAKDSTKTK